MKDKLEQIKKKAFSELYRLFEVTAFVMLGFSLVNDLRKDKSFIGKITNKMYREATTLIQALQPKLFMSAGRTASFIEDLGEALQLIILCEQYKTTDRYKGIEKLKRILKPVVISQFEKEKKKAEPALPKMPNLPQLPGLPALPAF